MAEVVRPKQPRNLRLTLGAGAALLALYGVGSGLAPWSAKRGLGLAFGVAAALILLFETLYAGRRPDAWPLPSARAFLQAHVYLGVFGLLAVLLHTGFRWPRGGLGQGLLALTLWTSATGLLGVWLQKWVPATLSEGLSVEAIYERIPELTQDLAREAEALVAGSSDVLERFYRSDVRPRLVLSPSWSFLLDVRGGRERALEPFERILPFVEEREQETVADLRSLFTEKLELDAQYSLQGMLRRWPLLHVPAAGLLLGLVAVHVMAWAWY